MDSKLVIQAVTGVNKVSWRIHHIIEDITIWRGMGISLTFKHIFCEVNQAVDWLARYGHSIPHSFLVNQCFSTELKSIIAEDGVGHASVRKGA